MARQADVIIPVYSDVEVTRACIESVLEHTGPELGQLLVINDCSPDPEMQPMLAALAEEHPRVTLLRNEKNLGFVRTVNRGLGLRERDVVLLNSDTRVTPGWLVELLEVAYESDRTCAVVPLSNNATICSVPEYGQETKAYVLQGRERELGLGEDLPRSTRVPTGVGFCLLLKHVVLNMIGGLDPAYGRGYNEENDWCARAQQLGFMVLRANRALVYHLGSISFGEERNELDRRNAQLLVHRYPYYYRQVQLFEAGPEARVAAHQVKRRLTGPAACVDATHLGGGKINGTGVYAVELLRALREHTDLQVAARVRTPAQVELFESLDIPTQPAERPLAGYQVLHRPAQVFAEQDLADFLQMPCHTVISYLDLIAYRAPSVFGSFDDCVRYRAWSYAALQSAQAVIAISEHNRKEIIEEFRLPPERVHAIHLGIDLEAFQRRDAAANREVLKELGVRGPYFLYAGSDYAHKNLRLLLAGYALYRGRREAAGTSRSREPVPRLVLIGPASRSAGSLYDRTPAWPAGVTYLGALPEEQVRALFQEASAFVYPTAYEGFGFPAVEAMACGVPLIASSLTSVPEVAGDAALYLQDFSPEELAGHLEAVAHSAEVRQRLSAAGLARAPRFSWRETARKTAEVYLDVIDRPPADTLFHRQMLSHLVSEVVRRRP